MLVVYSLNFQLYRLTFYFLPPPIHIRSCLLVHWVILSKLLTIPFLVDFLLEIRGFFHFTDFVKKCIHSSWLGGLTWTVTEVWAECHVRLVSLSLSLPWIWVSRAETLRTLGLCRAGTGSWSWTPVRYEQAPIGVKRDLLVKICITYNNPYKTISAILNIKPYAILSLIYRSTKPRGGGRGDKEEKVIVFMKNIYPWFSSIFSVHQPVNLQL